MSDDKVKINVPSDREELKLRNKQVTEEQKKLHVDNAEKLSSPTPQEYADLLIKEYEEKMKSDVNTKVVHHIVKSMFVGSTLTELINLLVADVSESERLSMYEKIKKHEQNLLTNISTEISNKLSEYVMNKKEEHENSEHVTSTNIPE